MDVLVRAAVIARCRGLCEHCGKPLNGRGELDHFFGRAKADETAENCWFLALDCGRAKTENKPDAATWFRAFIEHAQRHGYTEAATRAGHRLFLINARTDQREAERSREAAAADRRAAQRDDPVKVENLDTEILTGGHHS